MNNKIIEAYLGTKRCFKVKGTENQIREMQNIWSKESYYLPKAEKYFIIYKSLGSGVFMFPKQRYFVSLNQQTNYRSAFEKFTGASLDAFI